MCIYIYILYGPNQTLNQDACWHGIGQVGLSCVSQVTSGTSRLGRACVKVYRPYDMGVSLRDRLRKACSVNEGLGIEIQAGAGFGGRHSYTLCGSLDLA